jgi:hypothetical protein
MSRWGGPTRVGRRVASAVASVTTTFSLVISIALTILWVRSYSCGDQLSASGGWLFGEHNGVGISSWQGRVSAAYVIQGVSVRAPVIEIDYESVGSHPPGISTYVNELLRDSPILGTGVRLVSPEEPPDSMWLRFALVAPHWLLVTLSATPPLMRLHFAYQRAARKRRARAGLCPRCGYDLRGLSGGRCPECGTAVPARAEALSTPEPGNGDVSK